MVAAFSPSILPSFWPPFRYNGFLQKIVPKFSRTFWQSKFSETAFLAKSAGNGVRHLARNAKTDPMVKISSKSDEWIRKIRISVKIRKSGDFRTIFVENPLPNCLCFGGPHDYTTNFVKLYCFFFFCVIVRATATHKLVMFFCVILRSTITQETW